MRYSIENRMQLSGVMQLAGKQKSLVKQLCICCTETGKSSNKEHIFPQWLLKKTNTFSKPIKGTAGTKKIPGKHCVIPICEECNTALGKELESPVSRIMEQIESGAGFNDQEAEILIRWLWKITGMFYWLERADDTDSYGYINIKERCLQKIEMPRDRISLAVSLIEQDFDDGSGQTPMGIDVIPLHSNVLAAGVFNRVAMIVYYTKYEKLVPDAYTKYTLSNAPLVMNQTKRICPKAGFATSAEAVGKTVLVSNGPLLHAHETDALEQMMHMMQAVQADDGSLPEELAAYVRGRLNEK